MSKSQSQVSVNFVLDKRNAGQFGLPPWRVTGMASGFLGLKPTSLSKWDHKKPPKQNPKKPHKPKPLVIKTCTVFPF